MKDKHKHKRKNLAGPFLYSAEENQSEEDMEKDLQEYLKDWKERNKYLFESETEIDEDFDRELYENHSYPVHPGASSSYSGNNSSRNFNYQTPTKQKETINYKNKNSYELLNLLCKDNKNYPQDKETLTNRVKFIINVLNDQFSFYQIDMFESGFCSTTNYVNIIVKSYFNPNNKDSIIFLAHHDVCNYNSENAQDNSASVCNLLYFNKLIKNSDINFDKNIYIVFTDAEERGMHGADRLAKQIKEKNFGNVEAVINLELTGKGKNLWVDVLNYGRNRNGNTFKFINNKFEGFTETTTPPSDSGALCRNGVDSLCIGILPNKEIKSLENNLDNIHIWNMCHSIEDTFDKVIEEDMINFVENILMKLIV